LKETSEKNQMGEKKRVKKKGLLGLRPTIGEDSVRVHLAVGGGGEEAKEVEGGGSFEKLQHVVTVFI